MSHISMSDKTWGIMASVQAEIELHKIEIVLVRMNMATYMDFVELWQKLLNSKMNFIYEFPRVR